MVTEPETDGSTDPGFDREALYEVVHTAVRDALLDVLGTVALLGLALLFVAAGVRAFGEVSTTLGVAGASGVVLLGFVLAAWALDLIPPFRDRFQARRRTRSSGSNE